MKAIHTLIAFLGVSLWLALGLSFTALAQETPSNKALPGAAPSVAAAAASEQARILAASEVTQLRLEVFDLNGARLFDSAFKAGNLLEWNWLDQQGQRLPDGAYRAVITVKDQGGRDAQRQGVLRMENSEPHWQAPDQVDSLLRTKALAAADRIAYFTPVANQTELAAAVLAHDGNEARLMTGNGGLSVRSGNFLKGDEKELMRLTAEGKLEVKGLIQTNEGIVFPDGTVQKTAFVALGSTLQQLSADGKPVKLAPNVGGSGTPNVLMKWAANGVDATNSSVTDLGPGGGITVNGSVLSSFNNVSATGDSIGGYMAFWPTGANRAMLLRSASLSGNLWIGHLGNVGLNASNPGSRFATGGNATIGAGNYGLSAPTNGLLVQGRVGVGTTNPSPASTFAANGNTTIGTGFYATAAPTNGLLVEGNVGIGTTTPGAKLEVLNTFPGASVIVSSFDAPAGALIVGRAANGTPAAPAATQAGDYLLFISARGHTGSDFQSNGTGSIELIATENYDTGRGIKIVFSTTANATLPRTERMVIDHDGQVGIGETAPADSLDVNGDIRVGTTGTNGCLKNNGGGMITGTCSSDLRFKQNVTAFPRVLNRFAQLRPVHYYWRAGEFPDKHFGAEQSYGLIAQEVEQVLPELVSVDAQGFKQVDYSKLPLLTIQAIKEQQAQIQQLLQANQRLQQRLHQVERKVKTRRR